MVLHHFIGPGPRSRTDRDISVLFFASIDWMHVKTGLIPCRMDTPRCRASPRQRTPPSNPPSYIYPSMSHWLLDTDVAGASLKSAEEAFAVNFLSLLDTLIAYCHSPVVTSRCSVSAKIFPSHLSSSGIFSVATFFQLWDSSFSWASLFTTASCIF